MGMFDYVRCEVPLPDGWRPEELQSKDFDCAMTTVLLRADGRLLIEDFEYVEVPKAERPYPDDDGLMGLCGALRRVNRRWRDLNHHGWFNFYGSERGQSGEMWGGPWHEYNAKFTDGVLVSITGGTADEDASQHLSTHGEVASAKREDTTEPNSTRNQETRHVEGSRDERCWRCGDLARETDPATCILSLGCGLRSPLPDTPASPAISDEPTPAQEGAEGDRSERP